MQLQCAKCSKTMDERNFYRYKDGTYTDMCKKCLTMHINNYDPDTFLWLLEKMDVPYLPSEWNSLRDKAYEQDPNKAMGGAVFGKYMSKMKGLAQQKNTTWADTDRLQKEIDDKRKEREAQILEQIEKAQYQYQRGEITEAEYKTLTDTTFQREAKAAEIAQSLANNAASEAASVVDESEGATTTAAKGKGKKNAQPVAAYNPFDESQFMPEEDLPDPAAELTQEDKIALAMKWGRLQRPNEWIALEKNYVNMKKSFDIKDADTENALILLCKTNLKMTQAIDIGDFATQSQLSKVADSLRKSAKFTAIQNKEEKVNVVSCVGELVNLAEREEGFIPRYAPDVPQDKVDLCLRDYQAFVKNLVENDYGFGQAIEDAVRKIKIQQEMNENSEEEQQRREALGQDDYEPSTLADSDFVEFSEFSEQQKVEDIKVYEDYRKTTEEEE